MDNREQVIRMIKGDTLAFNMVFSGLSTDLDGAKFSVKSSFDSNTYTIQKTLNNGITKESQGFYSVRVAPGDTSSVDPGSYYYDLEVTVGSDVFTIMFGILNILPQIS